MDEAQLRYRRQFLLCRDVIPSLAHWKFFPLKDGLCLYSHPDLDFAFKELNGIKIILLGYIFDPIIGEKSNEEILADITEESDTFDSLIKAIKRYAGQFVFIYVSHSTFSVIHDPLALREIYYCTSFNKIICGSQPNLIKKYSDPLLEVTENRDIIAFHDHDLEKLRSGRFWIGDETYYNHIKHLLPNHYLDVTELRAIRYWPGKALMALDLDEVVHRSCAFLQSMLRAAAKRSELMMAVTGGTDSRTLLAASREMKDKIYYFINKHKHLDEKHPDIYIPIAIFNKINIPFHVHDLEGEVDEKFREIFLGNTFLSSEKNLPAIYLVYFRQHTCRLNILGVGEIGRVFFGDEPRKIDGYYLARSLKIKNSPYAVEQCQKWLDNALPVARQFGVNIMTLLLWEQLLGNWGVVGNSESDIAIEEFDPFNSHYLYELLLSVDKKYLKEGDDIVFREMIRQMWPELLSFPINPLYKKKDLVSEALKKVRLYQAIKWLVYKLDELRFRIKHRQHR